MRIDKFIDKFVDIKLPFLFARTIVDVDGAVATLSEGTSVEVAVPASMNLSTGRLAVATITPRQAPGTNEEGKEFPVVYLIDTPDGEMYEDGELYNFFRDPKAAVETVIRWFHEKY